MPSYLQANFTKPSLRSTVCGGSGVFLQATPFHVTDVVEVTRGGQPVAMHSVNVFATTAQLHHFASTLLRLSHLIHIELVHCEKLY
jgi:hypothetical protein